MKRGVRNGKPCKDYQARNYVSGHERKAEKAPQSAAAESKKGKVNNGYYVRIDRRLYASVTACD